MDISPDDLTDRLNVEIPTSLNQEINSLLPHGTKSEVVRGLLRALVIELRKPHGLIIAKGLCNDEVVLRYDQSLVKG